MHHVSKEANLPHHAKEYLTTTTAKAILSNPVSFLIVVAEAEEERLIPF